MSDASFVPILSTLNAHEVEYFVVGALGAALQGAPVVTFDVDIVHRRTPENVTRLLSALQELDATYRLDPRKLRPGESHLSGPGHQLLKTKHGDLDVLGTIMEKATYDDLVGDTLLVDLDGVRVRVLELARLIESKEFAGRPKDLAVLPTLRATLAEIHGKK